MEKIVALFVLRTRVTICDAQIKLPKVIGSNMIPRRNKPVALCGYTEPSNMVKVYFERHLHESLADRRGK